MIGNRLYLNHLAKVARPYGIKIRAVALPVKIASVKADFGTTKCLISVRTSRCGFKSTHP
jgi:hypothetical protein